MQTFDELQKQMRAPTVDTNKKGEDKKDDVSKLAS